MVVELGNAEDGASVGLPGANTNLHLPLTSFVGRVRELETLSSLLSKHRLVTVTGVGGSGKTRLAMQAALSATETLHGGAWFVDLAPAHDVSSVTAATLGAIGVAAQDDEDSLANLLAGVGERQMLLILDNCEHLTSAVRELVPRVLRASRGLHVLATSRVPLNLYGEARLPLSGLDLPDTDGASAGASGAAVELFLERARLVDPGFDCPIGTITALVRRLDGLPLAIELAAAQAATRPLSDLLARLDSGLGVLSATAEPGSDRHRSLEATLLWSYDILTDAERTAFRRLSVFPSPFSLEAADAILGEGAADVIGPLVETSLLMPARLCPDGRWRYQLLQILRSFAADLLERHGDRRNTMRQALGWALEASREASPRLLDRSRDATTVAWFQMELGNLSSILEWASDEEPVASLELAVALAPAWERLLRRHQGVEALTRSLQRAGQADRELIASAHLWLGKLGQGTDMDVDAIGHYAEVLSMVPDTPLAVEAQVGIGSVLLLRGQASALVSEELASSVRRRAASAIRTARRIDDRTGLIDACTLAGQCSARRGDMSGAHRWALRARRLDPQLSNPRHVRSITKLLAQCAIFQDDAQLAVAYCQEGLDEARRAGDQKSEVWYLDSLAYAKVLQCKWQEAVELLRAAFSMADEAGERSQLLNCIDTTACLCAGNGMPDEAATLWAFYDPFGHLLHACQGSRPAGNPAEVWRRGPKFEQSLSNLDAHRLEAATEFGSTLTLETAVTRARLSLEVMAAGAAGRDALYGLSDRELELLRLVASGLTDQEVAEQMSISIRTVRSHLDRIGAKTGSRRRADLTRLAVRSGAL